MKFLSLIFILELLIISNAQCQFDLDARRHERELKSCVESIQKKLDSPNPENQIKELEELFVRANNLVNFYSIDLKKQKNKEVVKILNNEKIIFSKIVNVFDSIEYGKVHFEYLTSLSKNDLNSAKRLESTLLEKYSKWKKNLGDEQERSRILYFERARNLYYFEAANDFYNAKNSFLQNINLSKVAKASSDLSEMYSQQQKWNDGATNVKNIFMDSSLVTAELRLNQLKTEQENLKLMQLKRTILELDPEFNFDFLKKPSNSTILVLDSISSQINSYTNVIEELRERNNIPPIEFSSATIYYDVLSTPNLRIALKNIGNTTIDAFEATIFCYNRFDEPVNVLFYRTNKGTILNQETIEPNREGGYLTTYPLYFQEETSKVKIQLKRIHFIDGKIWMSKPDQDIFIIANTTH